MEHDLTIVVGGGSTENVVVFVLHFRATVAQVIDWWPDRKLVKDRLLQRKLLVEFM